MKNPIIGISLFSDSEKVVNSKLNYYIDAIRDFGGIPIIFPVLKYEEKIEKLINICDGFIIAGGNDVNPKLYNEEIKSYCMKLDEDRDYTEVTLIKELLKRDKPLLAICRGFQILNVVLGGSLYQDIDIDIFSGNRANHRQEDKTFSLAHNLELNEEGLLYKILDKKNIGVNTLHHQALKDLGKNIIPGGITEDEIVEAYHVEGKRFFLGVQWHPELLYKNYEEQRKIFKALIEAC